MKTPTVIESPPQAAPPVSVQAVSYAKAALKGLHESEIDELAFMLHEAMRETAARYIAMIRK